MKFLSQINVNTEYTLPIVDGTNGQVLATDGNGTAYWGSVSAGATNLDGLTDVIITSPSSGQLLRYGIPPGSGEAFPVWYNFTPNYLTPSSSIDNLGDVTITTATAGQILQWNGTAWVNATLSTVEYVSKVQHLVKCGVAVTKGQAVYVTTSDGTNMIVGLASNASEPTSSKVIGLAASTGAINDQIFVVTEGLIAGLNTSTASAGDPVWLGTGGNLIFGLLNKPVAPAHLVYLGVVTRVQQNNGEIFVNVQNGFELHELHDVLISSPSAGQLIRRDSDGLWKNWTPNYLTSLPVHNHDDRYYTESEIAGFFGGEAPIAGYNATNWDTAYSWGDHALAGYLTSFTESDTLSSVTGRGNTTTTRIGVLTSTAINLATAGNLGTWIGGIQDGTTGWAISNNGIGLKADNTTYSGIAMGTGNGPIYFGRTLAGGTGTMASWLEVNSGGTANFKLSRPQHNGSNLALVSEIPTNLNQLTNGPGYITGYTETDTLASVIGRGSIATHAIFTGDAQSRVLYLRGAGNIIQFQDASSANKWEVVGRQDQFYIYKNDGTGSGYKYYIDAIGNHAITGDLSVSGGFSASGYNKSNWDTAYGWGNHATQGYATQTWVGLNYYNEGEIDDFFSGAEAISGYNKSNWDTAYNDRITTAAVTGTGTKTLTLTQGDGGTVTATWTDYDTDTDAQQLTWDPAQTELSISGGNDVTLTGLATEDYVNSQGFVTSESDTLATVTARGASTSTLSSFNGGLTTTKTAKSSYAIQIKGAYYGSPRLQLYDLSVDSNAFLGLGVDMSTGSYEFSNYFPRYNGYGRWSVGSWAGDFGTGQYVSGYNEKFWINESSSGINVPLTFNQGNWIKLYHSEETDSNDGKIGSGIFGTGLCIVGTETSAGTGRQIRFYGSVIDSSGNVFWHAGNDGSGSGLDADLLDGQHGSYYQPASTAITTSNIGSQNVNYAEYTNRTYRGIIEDTRSAQRTPSGYDDYRVSWEFTDQITGIPDWHTVMTMQGWHDGYAAWQIIGPSSTTAHENWYLRSGNTTTWNTLRRIWHNGDFTSTNVSNWNAAHNDRITAVAVSGTGTKTLTLTQQDGGTLTATWTDYDTDNDAQTLSYDQGAKQITISNGNSITLDNLATEDYVLSQGFITSVPTPTKLVSPNGATVVAADSALPDAGHSFIHTLALGPGGNDGHILGMTWAGTTSIYGAQIFLDTDPNDIMAIRSRSSAGVWTSWKTVIHSGTIGSQSVAYATSSGNADTLDSYHASSFLRSDIYNSNYGGLQVFRNIGTNTGSWPDADHTFGLENSDAGYIVVNFHRAGYTSNNLLYTGSSFRFDLALESTGVITASGGNSGQWNTAYGWGNHASAGYITASYLDDYTRGAYRVISDYNGNTTWYIRSNGQFIWGNGHDWTQSFRLNLSHSGGANAAWAYFGQQDSNETNGRYRGVRIRKYASGAATDGDISAAAYYIGDTRKDGNWDTAYSWGNHADAPYWNVSLNQDVQVEAQNVTFAGNVIIQGTLTESSSIRFKENIQPLEPALAKVEQLNPVTYTKITSQEEEIGLIAEEVAELFPEVVTYNENGQPQGVSYSRLSVILLKAVQELTERVNKLENK